MIDTLSYVSKHLTSSAAAICCFGNVTEQKSNVGFICGNLLFGYVVLVMSFWSIIIISTFVVYSDIILQRLVFSSIWFLRGLVTEGIYLKGHKRYWTYNQWISSDIISLKATEKSSMVFVHGSLFWARLFRL
ncbi:hypothetical protein E3Q17_01015 [Wallemia mellicola]|uniref:Uncharacterized protein n=1 Tax=Wallemia mellicola TaxID=1708541 RepID=A0A4T0NZC8_9BASI|nr:hypothetical protein E3Q17_01015 [Wallemia mellicola]TIC19718.1 hypothetical protein E3Q13_01012 [Wallemia mellicola]